MVLNCHLLSQFVKASIDKFLNGIKFLFLKNILFPKSSITLSSSVLQPKMQHHDPDCNVDKTVSVLDTEFQGQSYLQHVEMSSVVPPFGSGGGKISNALGGRTLLFALNSQTHSDDRRFTSNSLLGNFINYAVHLCMCAYQIVGKRPGELHHSSSCS